MRLFLPLTILLFTGWIFCPLLSQRLSSVERRIIEHIDAHNDEAIAFLETIVNVNSGTMHHAGVEEVGRIFEKELAALGFNTRWIPMEEVNRAGHLFAEHQGGEGKTVLLIGHLDTVFEKDSPFQRFERQGSTAKGPGVEDMKGGDTVMLYALKALHGAGVLKDANVIVALIGDEEDTGDPLSISRRDLIEAAKRSDAALGFEGNAGENSTATIARRGFTGWLLRVTSQTGHSSQVFENDFGSGAIYEAARILHTFHEELQGEEYLTFNPGTILGGTSVEFDPVESRGSAFGKTNVIAEETVVAGDLRFISEEQREQAKEKMRAIVARNLPHTSAEITFEDSYPPMSPTDGNKALLEKLDQVSRDLGMGPVHAVDPRYRGAADVSFAAPHSKGAIDGLGVVGYGGHTVDETVDLDSLAIMTKRAAILIYRLTREENPN